MVNTMAGSSELLSTSVDAKSQSSIRLLQSVRDSVRDEEREKALGMLLRGLNTIVPGIPFWAFREVMYAQGYLEMGVEGGFQVAESKLHRAMDLTSRLGCYGELCMVSIQVAGEENAIQAEYQVTSRDGAWEPIPICQQHEDDAIATWNIQDPVLEPLVPIWPPWSIPPSWGRRQENIFSHDRYAYAAWQQAVLGDLDGAFFTAMCFETGCGLLRSAENAVHYYTMAAKEGYPGAQEGVERCKRRGPWEQKIHQGSEESEEVPWWQS